MWHTSSGDRVIKGAEALMIKSAITEMVEMIREESAEYGEQWEYGVRLFDELEWSQRPALLDQVATYLLTDTRDSLDLSAVNEAAVGAIFEQIKDDVSLEIDVDQDRESIDIKTPTTTWRQMILNACAETFGGDVDDEFELPTLTSANHDDWHGIVESLADGILWDRDYEMGSGIFDAPPEKSNMIKQYMGIDDEYYATPAPDAKNGASVDALFEHIDALTRR